MEHSSVATPQAVTDPVASRHQESRFRSAERHPSDVLRVVIGTALLAVGVVIARAAAGSELQRQFFQFVREWPRFLDKPANVIHAVVVGLPLVGVVVMLGLRRWRGAVSVVVAVAVALGLTWLAARLAGHSRPALRLGPPPRDSSGFPIDTFPSMGLALAVATVAACAPFLRRALQRLAWTLVVLAVSPWQAWVGPT